MDREKKVKSIRLKMERAEELDDVVIDIVYGILCG